ncbi:alpha/beta fold hydrolase [Aldersonia sp. NBC_00410]|uniref:esterase/lipase family protein n=1 Tax=Aldersonia sp. NBC_00410 TaxID=2975954 RepID=UPI00225351CB|nr:alpha/beta fold hydrolase [Aldersonia sp. NBC_00410]MCX5043241.1 alpha/beta fold hydrolase [Aldersonia sp. NBC_00410]
MISLRVLVGGVLTALATFAGTATGHSAPLPVTYNFFSGIPAELTNPGGSLPGSNDWTCKPSAEHPNPVVLVHGTGGAQQTNWGVYAPLLANEGYCVFAPTYGNLENLPWPVTAIGGLGPIEQSAGELSGYVDRVLAATGASKVDLVGHSQGTLMPTYYLEHLGGASKVDKYVSLAPLWNGTNAGGGALIATFARGLGIPGFDALLGPLCGACSQMLTGSPFITDLQAGGMAVQGITYTNIMTRYDELVVPYTSGILNAPNATNIVVQDGCAQDYSDHVAIAGSRRAATFVLNALDPAHPRPVPCDFVAPIIG